MLIPLNIKNPVTVSADHLHSLLVFSSANNSVKGIFIFTLLEAFLSKNCFVRSIEFILLELILEGNTV